MTKAIITTIQAPTPAVRELARRMQGGDEIIIIGDRKGPFEYPLDGTRFLSLGDQLATSWQLARSLPVGHYSRKNIGYLEAIARGATSLYETDDDNAPLDGWAEREESTLARTATDRGWVNVYRCFSRELIWPRGLPLDSISASARREVGLEGEERLVRAPIQQGLANGSPDVDAVWRLVLDRPIDFDPGPSVLLPAGSWCPFNSQSTWWWPDAFPLLYLPSYCSFRMTDIWRSFIAQRCLWELGLGIVFHAAEVVQDRNEHDFMRDFNDEVPGYQRNRELALALADLPLVPGLDGVSANLVRCYEKLVELRFFAPEELGLVKDWLTDFESADAFV